MISPIYTNAIYNASLYLKPTQPATPTSGQGVSQQERAQAPNFGQVVGKMVEQVNGLQQQADQTVQEFALGKKDILAVSMAINKADLGLKLATEVRNKAIEAYQEVMRMNV
jgi:flagellar hook-basal body complex protein FliE